MTLFTSKLSIVSLISILIVLLAIFLRQRSYRVEQRRLEVTLKSLLRIEKKIKINTRAKVALGYGSCIDYFIDGQSLIIDNFDPPEDVKHHHSIASLDELLQVFGYFFKHGAAAERYINNSTLFKELLQLSEKRGKIKKSIGGNAPIMASRFTKEGVSDVLLGSQASKELRTLLPSEIAVSGPETSLDDVHLLIEYPAGARWGEDLIAPRANRFIVHNDIRNSLISSLELFHDKANEFGPNLFVIGGLQMMDNFPDTEEKRTQRLQKMETFLEDLSQTSQAKVHFEMASFTEKNLLRGIVDHVLPHVHSIGMNEQELPNLHQILNYGNISLVSNAYPRVASVLDEMRDLFYSLYSSYGGKLSRIHVHTLAFQAIMIRSGSSWKNTRHAAAKAALTAHRHTCGSDVIDTAYAKLIMDDSFTTTRNTANRRRIVFNESQPVACWIEDMHDDKHPVEICVAPVLVCTEVIQTGGGGDNVSAAGLVVQIP